MKRRYNDDSSVRGVLRGLLVCFVLLLGSCMKEPLPETGRRLQVEEGIEGTLTVAVGGNDFEQRVSVLTRSGDLDAESDEQHIHSIYLFVVNIKDENDPASCPVIARKYFPDVTDKLEQITINEELTLPVVKLSMKVVSCQRAEIFAIANVGYSDLQHVANDDELLHACDAGATLADLHALTARLSVSDEEQVRVERRQGHLLMSGFFVNCTEDAQTHYLSGHNLRLSLVAEDDGSLSLYDADNTSDGPFTPLGKDGEKAGAVILQRLDAKVTFNITPVGELAATEGAYFHLKSWQVKNAPVDEQICWHREIPDYIVSDSKIFQRDITQTPDGGYTFTFYQFENCTGVNTESATFGYHPINGGSIAEQYNMQYGLQPGIDADDVAAAFPDYPNEYTNFAYGLRARQEKSNPDGTPYDPEPGDEDDGTETVVNGDWAFAPQKATYVLLTGKYYNPAEPVRRRKDDPRNADFPEKALEDYPFWSVDNLPVRTAAEAATRTRMADVTYVVHLGYVGGGNFDRSTAPIPGSIASLDEYVKKVNDYNVLRNHHYVYTIGISGVNSVKVEATREDGGNAYGQEKQPGSEGNVIESQHLFNVDAHYETRNLTLDFERMPEGHEEYGFRLKTCYESLAATLKRKDDGTYGVFDESGHEMTDIRGHDLDWIHFAWHGTDNAPSRSLIDPQTGNGIPYSKTYGGYLTQQTYDDPNGELLQEKDAEHPYYLMNSAEFVAQVWELYRRWLAKGRPAAEKTVTFTVYVDEYFYDHNPLTGGTVDWMSFCTRSSRAAFYFMEGVETSADEHSFYTNAHVAISQRSIQTPYATSTAGGQTVADVAFGIEHLDEFDCKYNSSANYADQYFAAGTPNPANGLFNTMQWYNENAGNSSKMISWKLAEDYFNDKVRSRVLRPNDYNNLMQDDDGNRANRKAAWAVYSRNRDLNRDGELQPAEVRWFVPTAEQYTICFLAGRPAFDYPLYEPAKSHRLSGGGIQSWLIGVPFLHYITGDGQVFWAEEGCSLSGYNDSRTYPYRSIRMARMLTRYGVVNTGAAIASNDATVLLHDPVYIISETRNGPSITDYNTLADGKNYYVTLNKLNTSAFRDYVHSNDLAQHDHEQLNNQLFREFKIARHKIGYTAYDNADWTNYDRTPKIDGIPRTWWQLNGVWAPFTNSNYFSYNGPTTSIAWSYTEDVAGNDLHRWRVPNLRETAIMSLVFPSGWFNGYLTARTRSANLMTGSTNVPYFNISARRIRRMSSNDAQGMYIRPVHDVQADD